MKNVRSRGDFFLTHTVYLSGFDFSVQQIADCLGCSVYRKKCGRADNESWCLWKSAVDYRLTLVTKILRLHCHPLIAVNQLNVTHD